MIFYEGLRHHYGYKYKCKFYADIHYFRSMWLCLLLLRHRHLRTMLWRCYMPTPQTIPVWSMKFATVTVCKVFPIFFLVVIVVISYVFSLFSFLAMNLFVLILLKHFLRMFWAVYTSTQDTLLGLFTVHSGDTLWRRVTVFFSSGTIVYGVSFIIIILKITNCCIRGVCDLKKKLS